MRKATKLAESFPSLSAENERRRKISIPHAAFLKGVSVSTFMRQFPHLVEQLSARRKGCELGKVLDA
jgi:hypothetical protein